MFGEWLVYAASLEETFEEPEKEVVVSGFLHKAEISVAGGGGEDPGEPGQ